MPKISKEKQKLLYLLQMLWKETDETHALTLPKILQNLEELGIHAERKSVYDDLETLQSVGVRIKKQKSRAFEYSIVERPFSLEELQILAQGLRSSTGRKRNRALLEKLGILCSRFQAEALSRESPGPQEERSLDAVQIALRTEKKVRFTPLNWLLSGEGAPELVPPKKESRLTVSPWKLEGRELLAFEETTGKLGRFRIDKMADVEILSIQAEKGPEGLSQPEREEKLVLEFSFSLLGEVAERFGSGIHVEQTGKNKYRTVVRAPVNSELFSWLFSLGTDMRLVSPKKAAGQFRERAKLIAKHYKS